MIVAGTGHRPPSITIGDRNAYDPAVFRRLVDLSVSALQRLKASQVIAGGALGFDQALATGAVELGVPVKLYLPFPGYDSRWPVASRAKYDVLRAQASDIVWVTPDDELPRDAVTGKRLPIPSYMASAMLQKRNRAMVDACLEGGTLLALWNGLESGGTWNAVQYARSVGCPVTNAWGWWNRHAAHPRRTQSRAVAR